MYSNAWSASSRLGTVSPRAIRWASNGAGASAEGRRVALSGNLDGGRRFRPLAGLLAPGRLARIRDAGVPDPLGVWKGALVVAERALGVGASDRPIASARALARRVRRAAVEVGLLLAAGQSGHERRQRHDRPARSHGPAVPGPCSTRLHLASPFLQKSTLTKALRPPVRGAIPAPRTPRPSSPSSAHAQVHADPGPRGAGRSARDPEHPRVVCGRRSATERLRARHGCQ